MKAILPKAAIVGALTVVVSSISHAAVYVDNWQFGGSAWTSSYAPAEPSASDASITVSGYASGLDVGFGLYTLFDRPQFVLATDSFDSSTTTLSLTVVATEGPQNLTLNFNSENSGLTNYTVTSTNLGIVGQEFGFAVSQYEYVYTWDVSDLGESDGLSITWALNNHRVISSVSLSQVPETSSSVLAALALSASIFRRRR